MNSQKQRLLIEYLISSPDVYAICDSVLDPKHYDADLRPAVAFIKEYHREYSATPDMEIVSAETGVQLTPQIITRDKIEYCIAEVEQFAKKKAILHAVGESADLIQKGEYGTIEMLLKNALAVSVVKDLGVSLFDDPRTILNRIALSEKPISTGYDDVDKKLFGGLVRKQMLIISGPSGGGKSVWMNNLTLNYVESGHQVLFISFEMSQDMNYLRYASMISGQGLNGWFMNIDEISDRVERYQGLFGSGSKGNLFIKRLPSGSPPSAVRAVLKEFQLIHGVNPDLCVCDYLDIMGSDVKVSADNISLRDKYIAEGLREIAHDLDLMMVTGSQIQKSAQGDVDIDASQTAGGQTKMNTTDIWGNIMLTDEMKAAGIAGIKWLKTRTSDGRGKVSLMKFNPVSLRITNFDAPLTPEQSKKFLTLTKKAMKKMKVDEDDHDIVVEDKSTTQSAPKVQSWLDSMLKQEESEG